MSTSWLAGLVLMVLVLRSRSASVTRLRPYARADPSRRAWPRASSRRASSTAAELGVPTSLALELRSGRDLSSALAAVADELVEHPDLAARLRSAGEAAGSGEPVGPVLGGDDALGRALEVTAVCCDVSTSAGLALAGILDAVAGEARGRCVLVGRARAELAGARSTTVVLGCLPVVGLAMGQLLGARPWHVLLATGWGFACLLAAAALTGAGTVWSHAIRHSAERSLR